MEHFWFFIRRPSSSDYRFIFNRKLLYRHRHPLSSALLDTYFIPSLSLENGSFTHNNPPVPFTRHQIL
jgi:hypothetical protein